VYATVEQQNTEKGVTVMGLTDTAIKQAKPKIINGEVPGVPPKF
jgi:hypothetical protein